MSRAYGWTPQGHTIPDEADHLRHMAEWVADGNSVRQLAAHLNTNGVPTVGGGRWAPRGISRALQNPRMIGHRRTPDGNLVAADNLEPILDRTLWDRVLERLDDPDRAKFGRRRPEPALLAGLLRCRGCESPMYGAGTRYACYNTEVDHALVTIEEHLADTEISERTLARISSDVWRDALDKAARHSPDHYQRIIDDADTRIVALAETFGTGAADKAALDAGVAAARHVQDQARQDLALRDLSHALPPDVEEVAEWWLNAPLAARRQLLDILIDHVTVGPRVAGQPPADRLKVSWR